MSGSSTDRSRTSARADDRGEHASPPSWPRASNASRWRRPAALAATRCSAPGMPARSGVRLDQVDDQDPAARRPSRASPGSVPSYTSLPWSMTSTRSHSRSMSARSWVVSSRVVPRSRARATQELAQPLLADDVQADRRLVQDQQLGGVQQRRGDLAAHPLAERQLAHRGVEAAAQLQQLDQLVGAAPLPRRRRARWIAASMRERLAQRQVPPQLAALAEDHADPAGELAPLAHRVEPAGAHRARRSAPGCR